MPRAKRRIPRATVGQGRTLTAEIEWELAIWRGLDVLGAGLANAHEFDAGWREFRETILPAYVTAMPGSRPFGAYVVGEIQMPPIVLAPYQSDTGRTIGGAVFHDAGCYGIGDTGELEHLLRLGLVGAGEEAAARLRIEEHGPRNLYRWTHATGAPADGETSPDRNPGCGTPAPLDERPAEG